VFTDLENADGWLLQILYNNYDRGKFISSKSISSVLDMDEVIVIEGLNKLIEAQLVNSQDKGYRLSEKGYFVIYQREASYCPHL
jgi:Mn-dependent DtxR family transcriptional regulator